MVRAKCFTTRFNLWDFDDDNEKVMQHLTSTVGSIAAMAWYTGYCYPLMHNPYFEVMRFADSKYTIVVQKYRTDEIVVRVQVREITKY